MDNNHNQLIKHLSFRVLEQKLDTSFLFSIMNLHLHYILTTNLQSLLEHKTNTAGYQT